MPGEQLRLSGVVTWKNKEPSVKPGEGARSETSLAEGDELANTVVRDWPREVPRTTGGQEFPLVLFHW